MTSPGNREDAVGLKKPNIVLMPLEKTRSLGMHWPAGHVEVSPTGARPPEG